VKAPPPSAARQIAGFLAKYTPAIAIEGRAARRRLRALMPTATELVYDNYNTLAFGFAPGERASEVILSIALYPSWVTLFFLQGAKLADPGGLLCGSGSTVRHVRLDGGAADLERAPIRALIRQALARAKVPLPKSGRGVTIVKMVSAKQRPRRPRSPR
jgi:hypothetical protein